MMDDDLKALFDRTADEPSPARLTRMSARAAQLSRVETGPWWANLVPAGLVAGAIAAGIALGVSPMAEAPVTVPQTPGVVAELEEMFEETGEPDPALELAVGMYLDIGMDLEDDDDWSLTPLDLED